MAAQSFNSRKTLTVGSLSYDYYSLPALAEALGKDISRLPYSLKVILENLLRNENGRSVVADDVKAVVSWLDKKASTHEIAYHPARVLMQDFTGVPAVVDLAAMRDAMAKLGGDAKKINPLIPVDLVIDHSVQVDFYADGKAFKKNVELEMQRNAERYEFLRWGQEAFDNFRVVPPGTGICHQVNLEYLSKVVWTKNDGGNMLAYPDTLVGTDSHTTMVNGLAVLGWGVGGIEAEAAMLGQPLSMVIPEVIGFRLTGKVKEGVTATDLVLTVTNMLRKKGVVNKFVEFYGEGLNALSLADRATIANMAPEYGATCGFFPIDAETIRYLKLSARPAETIALVEAYAKAQGMWREATTPDPVFTDTLELDLTTVQPCVAGPKRPQDQVMLNNVKTEFAKEVEAQGVATAPAVAVKGKDYTLHNGSVMIAAITSCTNTSNPSVMLAAGLVARKANAKGLKAKPWVKTSLAPGSKVVTEYLEQSGLMPDLDAVGFNLVGYGCTTCIGNSGPLLPEIEEALGASSIIASSVLSGNRNFEGRVHPLCKANYLMSPPLVVAYALAGSVTIDITTEPLGTGADGKPVYLADVWPTAEEIAALESTIITPAMFKSKYDDVFSGDEIWQQIPVKKGLTYDWSSSSTYIKNPPYFEGMQAAPGAVNELQNARILALLGDSITTDHISPAGNISKKSPAADFLRNHGVDAADFNSYGARRGNDDVMVRGTFANIRIKNAMLDGVEGGYTKHIPSGETLSIYEAAMRYRAEKTPLVVFAGKEYGTGSSRDWAAKGTLLLGIKAVIAESFERIHRSNLVGMGVLPLVFMGGLSWKSLELNGTETITIEGLKDNLKPRAEFNCVITRANNTTQTIPLLCRIDTADEIEYFKNGGILQHVVRQLMKVA